MFCPNCGDWLVYDNELNMYLCGLCFLSYDVKEVEELCIEPPVFTAIACVLP